MHFKKWTRNGAFTVFKLVISILAEDFEWFCTIHVAVVLNIASSIPFKCRLNDTLHLVKMQKLRQTLESPDCMASSAVIGFRNKNQSLNRSHTRSQTSRDKVYLRYFLAIESIDITAVVSVCP